MTTEAAVSIVIPVLNEADNLPALLDDCAAQQPPPTEVIVVDAGSSDGTRELLDARSRAWPGLRVLSAPGARPGAGRNAGVRAATSALVATLDAGSRIAPEWLARLSGPVLADPERSVAVGRVESDPHSDFERAAGWFTLRAFKSPQAGGLVEGEFLPPGRNGYCFSRAAWEAAGGYPETLRWGEDKLFARSLRRQGLAIVIVPDAIVRWRPRRSTAELYRQYEGYGRGDVLAGVHRRHELIPLALYAGGAALCGVAIAGAEWAWPALAAAVLAYLGIFVAAGRRELPRAALAWIPVIRVVTDLAKIRGFLAASLGRLRR